MKRMISVFAVMAVSAAVLSVLSGCSHASKITVTAVDNAGSDSGQSYYAGSESSDTGTASGSGSASEAAEASCSGIAVYICGAVMNPGVYYLPAGSRACDALDAAGGFSPAADTQWINLAKTLSDGEMVVINTADETARMRDEGIERGSSYAADISSSGQGSHPDACQAAGSDAPSADGTQSKVNLNTASKEQLMTLPGIGEAKADSIIRYRTETGFFASIEDIMNISGIKNSIFEKIRGSITV